ncbi:MAG TPA: RagB/SusD family nutrient uptake outer membrane protein [Bacteroidales bacterium]|nr:RagB/SusD family nutrient uptake outer membrane protein [Bacteroidales bacterium]
MKKNKILLLLVATAFMVNVSCTEWLETEPRHAIDGEIALNDMAGIEGAIIGMYDILQSGNYYGRDMFVAGDLLSDNAEITTSHTNRFPGHPTNVVGAGFGEDVTVWTNAYRIINIANLILHHVGNVTDGTPERIRHARGQAYFMRGLAYFDLLRIYARNPNHPVGQPLGVIHKLTPFAGIDEQTFGTRSTILQGYQLVESDLLMAEDSLHVTADFPYRATRIAARALLARLYLYWGRWSDARTYAQQVRTDWGAATPWLAPPANYRNVFAATPGVESIFELRYELAEAQNINNSLQGILVRTEPGLLGYGDVMLREDLRTRFVAGDVRGVTAVGNVGNHMIQRHVKVGQTVHYTLKFNAYRGLTYWDDIEIIRTSEIHLTLAEADAHLFILGDVAAGNAAFAAINELRVARGLAPLATIPTAPLLLEEILLQRRLELMFEGHRWFDLIRLGRGIPKPGGTALGWDDFRTVMRIPLGERDANPNLVQNPGY